MNDLIADVKLAIDLEKKGFEFYSQTAAKTRNPLAASVLASLADREMVHLERIKQFYQEMTGEKKLKSDWLKGVLVSPTKAELLRPILEKLKSQLDKKFETTAETNDAYKIAEGLEKASFDLYIKLSNAYPDPTIKKFYAALAAEEQEHFEILDETLQYLNRPGDWFREKERWLVEG
jgi:rubrerythrin